MLLHDYLDATAQKWPDRTAVIEPGGRDISYRDLHALSVEVCRQLAQLSIGPGDRVGVYLQKSIDSVATILGILKAGAAYVPVDATAPAARNAYILTNCGVKALFVEQQYETDLRSELESMGSIPRWFLLDGVGAGERLRKLLEQQPRAAKPSGTAHEPSSADLAYILYTSGSTGNPKGVTISHENAVCFVEWAASTFRPSPEDRFSSHAPFHFDLSIFDIYVCIRHGGALVLIPDALGKEPTSLARFIAESGISIWYSTPSALTLLARYGKLGNHDLSRLRLILFAGEVFPVAHLRSLQQSLPHARYFNLYGPTETNVCTYFEVPAQIPADQTEPMPIGKVCSHLQGIVVDAQGNRMQEGEGELCIRGPGVTRGYWNLPDQTRAAFLDSDPDECWYRTGDIVRMEADGNYRFVGRRDRMVKKRGYRIELGEIESCLYRHPKIREAAVLALEHGAEGVRIHTHLSTLDDTRMSLVELKTFCAEHLPLYMVPDTFQFHPLLPKTSTNKTDYQALKQLH